jgi:hypothetical protein
MKELEMNISKRYLTSLFNDYIINLNNIDLDFGENMFNHIISSKRNASETQLYNKYYNKRFKKIAVDYLFEIISNCHYSIPLVDFGGGTGVLSIFLSIIGYDVFVLDIEKKSLDICNKRAKRFNVNIETVVKLPKFINFNLISFFSIREASLNGASISTISKNANKIFLVDRNERYLIFKLFNRDYGLTINEIDSVFLGLGFTLSKRYGACLMPKYFSFIEPNNIHSYPLFMSSIYFSSYSRIN